MAKRWWVLSLAVTLALGAGTAMARGSVAQADPDTDSSESSQPSFDTDSTKDAAPPSDTDSTKENQSGKDEEMSAKPVKVSELSKDQVKKIQESLSSGGFYFGAIDGIAGPKTQAALSHFAHANALAYTNGELDGKMLSALDMQPSDVQPVRGKDEQKEEVQPKSEPKSDTKSDTEKQPQSGSDTGSTGSQRSNQSGKSPEYAPEASGANGSTSPASGGTTASNPTGMNAGTSPSQPGSEMGAPKPTSTPSEVEPQRGTDTAITDPATIQQAQKVLKQKGLYQGEATGTLDPNTKAAIMEFQKENYLAQTGLLDKDTLAKMGVAAPSGAMTPSEMQH
jgi:peptidoglycan hydrolase-like protein with peptidoglycan-binding domain